MDIRALLADTLLAYATNECACPEGNPCQGCRDEAGDMADTVITTLGFTEIHDIGPDPAEGDDWEDNVKLVWYATKLFVLEPRTVIPPFDPSQITATRGGIKYKD